MITFRQLREAIIAVQERPATLAGGELTPGKRRVLLEAPHLADLIKEMREEAEKAKLEPIPALTFTDFNTIRLSGTRKEYEKPYFARRGRLIALALTMAIDNSDVYKETLENLIWDICNEYAWAVPAHLPHPIDEASAAHVPPNRFVDLFAAETAHALAEVLYLVGNRLNGWVTHRVREEIEQRVFRPVFEGAHHFFWTAMTNNWSAVCSGAVGMAALLLVDDPERLAGMQDRVVSAMESFLAGYGDDGCCPEGASYWIYGFGYFVYWAEMLREFTDGTIDLLKSDKIKRIAEFPGTIALGASACINYSDCRPTFRMPTGLISRLSCRLGIAPPETSGIPPFHHDHCYRWPHVVRNLLWTEPECLEGRDAEGSYYFPSTEWLVVKHATPKGLLAFSAKGGHNNEPHNHNDLGHFILHTGGDSLLADLGMGVYTSGYFGEARYAHLHTSSAGHSVPVINGQQQAAGQAHLAVVTRNESENGTVRFELDLTLAYGPEAQIRSFHRLFEWENYREEGAAVLTLTDRFVFEEKTDGTKSSVLEHFISFHKPAVGSGTVTWRGENGTVVLRFDPSELSVDVETIETPGRDDQTLTVYRLRLHAGQLSLAYTCRLIMECRVESI
ncbi:heparinase II/III domain-containing protein [Paenibacillus nasutitermitis]|uniref:Heparinase II/III-like C-terminal domain-containing protein n=1 Tax=Paenibacillus nasutitermitis TaxID=1652958 RepID=A0A916YJF3_9BACL|nr:heparinase II/III family protein [Paenibacillus nasutitermitis]GGD47610.1 hypothetical protein GCM10010911_01430 [Paenibacillus nasutitermitis]